MKNIWGIYELVFQASLVQKAWINMDMFVSRNLLSRLAEIIWLALNWTLHKAFVASICINRSCHVSSTTVFLWYVCWLDKQLEHITIPCMIISVGFCQPHFVIGSTQICVNVVISCHGLNKVPNFVDQMSFFDVYKSSSSLFLLPVSDT
jgi:hypothetical protein